MGSPQVLTEHTVAASGRSVGLPIQPRFVPETGSTNSDLLSLAEGGAPEWTVLVAGRQTAGRGRLGRRWVTPAGTSLMTSVLLRPSIEPGEAALLSLAAGVAVAEACAASGVRARCKWPNDIVCDGRKLAGVLVEGSVSQDRLRHAVVGMGLNVGQSPEDFPPELRRTATSVFMQGGSADPLVLFIRYIKGIRSYYGEAGDALSRVVDRYRELCDSLGRTVSARNLSGRRVRGRAVGLGQKGELLIASGKRLETVGFGDIEHLD